MSFSPALFTAPASHTINSVEIARSDPMTMYLAMTSPTTAPLLARSRDGGAHFDIKDLEPSLGKGLLRIIAIDPDDPERVLLQVQRRQRAIDRAHHRRGRHRHQAGGGQRQLHVVRAPAVGDAAGRRHGRLRGRARAVSFARSRRQLRAAADAAFHPRAVAARRGRLRGHRQLQRRLRGSGRRRTRATPGSRCCSYDQVRAIIPCLKSRCQATCQTEVDLGLWPQEVCTASAPGMMMGTAGSSGAGGVGGAGASGGGGAGGRLVRRPAARATATAASQAATATARRRAAAGRRARSSGLQRGALGDPVEDLGPVGGAERAARHRRACRCRSRSRSPSTRRRRRAKANGWTGSAARRRPTACRPGSCLRRLPGTTLFMVGAFTDGASIDARTVIGSPT